MSARRLGERGAVLPLAAISLTVLVLFTSFAVDLGRVRMERRDLQSVADAVAFDMVRKLEHHGTPTWDTAIAESRNRNDFPASGTEGDDVRDLEVTPGCHDKPTDVFTPFGSGACTVAPDAVHVVARDTIDYLFQQGQTVTEREAIAAQPEKAQFQVGSFLAGIDLGSSTLIGPLLNSVLPQILPLPPLDPSVTAGGYGGLVDANVTFGEIIPYLPVTAGSPEELLDTQVTLFDLTVASANALRARGNTADANLLDSMATAVVDLDTQLRLGDTIGVGAGGSSAADTMINIPQLLVASAFLIDGEHLVNVPAAVVNVPFVGDVGLRLTGIEGPQKNTELHDGASASTRQIALAVTPRIDFATDQTLDVCQLPSSEQAALASLIPGILGALGCLVNLLGILPVVNRTFTVEVHAAPTVEVTAAEVTVTQDIDCDAQQLTLVPTPVAVDVTAALDLNATVSVLGTLLNGLTLAVGTDLGVQTVGTAAPQTFDATDAGPRHVSFDPPTARVGSNPLGLANLLNIGPTEVQVQSLTLDVTGGLLVPLLQATLNGILQQLDTLLLQPLAQLLGLSLAGADLTPLWMDCGSGGPELSR